MGHQKCGEIYLALKRRKEKVYTLACNFCQCSFSQLEQFGSHIEDLHNAEVSKGHQTDFVEIANIKVNTLDKEIKDEIMYIEEQEQHADDPLDDTAYEEDVDAIVSFENYAEPLIEFQPDPTERNVADEYDCIDDKKDEDFEMHDPNENYSTDSSTPADDTDKEDCDLDDTSERELIAAVIAGYEKQQILWDSNRSEVKNRKTREDAIKEITTALRLEYKFDITWQRVSQLIKMLRYKYRSEVRNKKAAQAKHKKYTSSWWFKSLEFLKESVKYKKRNKRGIHALANGKSALPLPNLSDEQNHQFIEIYKSYPCLWDMQDISLRLKHTRQGGLSNMLQMVKLQMGLDLTPNELQKKMYRVRYACTKEKHRKLQCEKLDRTYMPTCKFYEALAFLEPHVGPFQCAKCAVVINGADQFRIHISSHDGSMPFTCPICQRGFTKSGNCMVHVRRHTRDFAFSCKECGKQFATSTDVNVHMRQHTGEKPYFCEICGKSFRTWSFFDSHMRRHQKRPAYVCSVCPRAFYENNKLKEHMNGHLNVRDKVCNVCGKGFTSSKYLRQHKQIHAEKKKYMCRICKKEFAQYASLSRHMKTHGTTISGVGNEENQVEPDI